MSEAVLPVALPPLFERLVPRPLRAPGAALPARVQRAIAAAQSASEILISWVQLGIVATFGALYAASPKTFAADAPFAPVPWVLSAYGLFTLLRLFLAYRGALARWFLAASVAVDMALLMALIWSFHLQYMQPPAFYLKAPTLLYVFIFIALRALRFEAGYVILGGIAAAAGWMALVLYAYVADPGNPTTRDYVQYMTSPMILWGGEFDKVVSILLVTGVLALAIARARRTLVTAVAEGTAARELKRFFAEDVAQHIAEADDAIRPGQAERREAAVMFVDLRGFTPLSRTMAPEAVMALLGEYQARMVPAIRAHGGSIDKFLGDGILASFGAVRASATCAADALRAVDALLDAAEAWRLALEAAGRPAPQVGAAVAVGPVLFGAVGEATRLEYTVIGDAVNLAAKLEKHTKAAGVRALATAATLDLARRQGYAPAREPRLLRAAAVAGVDEPVDLAVLG